MSIVVIFGDRSPQDCTAVAEGSNLWIDEGDLARVSDWELKKEGVCKADVCVPIPVARQAEFIRDDGRKFNLAAFARLLGQPVLHNDKHGVWFFGEAAAARRKTLSSLEAPDFELPDLDGRSHRLSDYRGKKVLLAAWASW
jgi:hypothetical protein